MKTGIAYGFVQCESEKEEFMRWLNKVKKDAQTPSKLEITLTDHEAVLKEVPELRPMVMKAKISDLNYTLKATYPDNTNQETASELSAILANQAFSNLRVDLWGAVVYKEANGQYVEF